MVNNVFNEFFAHVYIINLKKRPDRLVRIIQKFRTMGLDFEVIEAVDGSITPHINNYKKYVHSSDYIYRNISEQKRIPSYGAWGYLLTWEKILNDAKSHRYPNFISFDDDIIFQKNFLRKFENFTQYFVNYTNKTLSNNNNNNNNGKLEWKVINFGASQHKSFETLEGLPYYYPSKTDGSFATAVHESIYDELLEQIRPMNIAFDSGALRYIYEKYPKRCFVPFPNLIISDVTDSNIRPSRDQEELAKRFRWDLSLYNYPTPLDLVSVILCAYNAETSIEAAMRSIMRQSYRALEIIVVNDCSKDRTGRIIDRLAREDNRIIIIHNEENLGCYGARNVGLRKSTGKYITFQDADDISLHHRIETQLNALLQYNVIFVTCHIIRSHLPNFQMKDPNFQMKDPIQMKDPNFQMKDPNFQMKDPNFGIDLQQQLDLNDKEILEDVKNLRTHYTIDPKNPNNKRYSYCCKSILGMVTTLFKREIFYRLGLYWELPCIADAEYCERVLFHYANKRFIGDESVVTFLTQNSYLPGIYHKVNQILYISKEMDQTNITNKFRKQKEIRVQYQDNWRQRLVNQFEYEYPLLF